MYTPFSPNNSKDELDDVDNIPQSKYPILFDPVKLYSTLELEQKTKDDASANLKVRLKLATFIIIFGVGCLILLSLLENHPLGLIIGLGVLAMYITYFITIFRLFLSVKESENGSLYRIYSSSSVAPNWAAMSVSSHQLLYKNKAIQSISEFSAIDGGIPNIMLATLSAFTWSTVMMYLAANISFRCDFEWDAADLCQIIGIFGLVIIGFFELDPYNQWMQRMHYFGALCGINTIIGYALQQFSLGTKVWFPITIGVAALIAFTMWQYFGYQTVKFEVEHENIAPKDIEKIRAEITCWSLKNVTAEAIFLFLGAMSTCLWMMEYDQNCDMGCRGPVNPECDHF